MNRMINKLIIVQICKSYKVSEVLKSFLTAFVFFALLVSILLLPVIQIVHLYVPFMEFFLMGIYIYISLISIYFNKLFVDTLKAYQVIDTINYDTFKVRSTTAMTILTFLIVFIVYVVLN